MAPDMRQRPPVLARPPYESVVLLLQGGGALGAYQAGVYEALAEAEVHPDWIAGISIGAINSAIIAGNAPKERVAKLRAFWELVTTSPPWDLFSDHVARLARGNDARFLANQMSATTTLMAGATGFFAP
ncbi:MAG TPA: patatin-like phospholipase family protein, partial [Stellaceae bacterium]|nr:patatin-like phospholipase family protein [Stellaceae bacterium]